MNRKRTIIIGTCVIAAIFVLIAIRMNQYYSTRFTRDIWNDDINSFRYVEFNHKSGSICFVRNGLRDLNGRIFEDKYIYLKDYDYIVKLVSDGGYTGLTKKINRVDINIYNLETGEFIKTIDIKNIMKEDLANYRFGRYMQMFGDSEGTIYVCIRIMGNISPAEYAYIDLETEEVKMILSQEEANAYNMKIIEKNENARIAQALIENDEIGIMKANNLEFQECSVSSGGIDNSYLTIRLSKESVPTGDVQLYKEFPGLIDCKMEEGDWLNINLNKSCGSKELIELFLEEGQEISFEGCVLPAESSIDGKEHEINSFEDYYQWKDWDKSPLIVGDYSE